MIYFSEKKLIKYFFLYNCHTKISPTVGKEIVEKKAINLLLNDLKKINKQTYVLINTIKITINYSNVDVYCCCCIDILSYLISL